MATFVENTERDRDLDLRFGGHVLYCIILYSIILGSIARLRFSPLDYGLTRIADYYLLRGDGSEATAAAAARNNGRTPRIHIFTDRYGKQYKGRPIFRFLTDSVRQIGFFVDHRFAATSHFKGCHDGIGGVAKNAMLRRRERFSTRIVGVNGVVSFLQSFFLERGGEVEEGMQKYFAKWSPYRIRKVHVRLIGKNEIYRGPARSWRV